MADKKVEVVITAKDQTKAAIDSAARGLNTLKTAGSGLSSTFATLGGAGGIIGLLGGAGVVSTLKSTIDELDKLNQSAERLGISASKFEVLDFAGKMAGLEDGVMEKALGKISIKLEEAAAGSKDAIAWFEKLGVSWKNAAGEVKTADKAFEDVSEKISGMAEGTGKLAIISAGFGEKIGRQLVPALNSGANGLDAVRKELELLGGQGKSLDDLAKQADDFNDSMDKLAFYSKAAGRSLTSELLPSLNDTALAMLRLAGEGENAWAILRGIAGLGKIPFDLAFGSSKPDLTVATAIKEKKEELKKLDVDLAVYEGGGFIGRLLVGKKGEVEKKIEIAKNQLAALEKYGKDIKPTEVPRPEEPKGGLQDQSGDKPKNTSRDKADEAARLLATLNEQIAVKEADAAATDKQSEAEKQAVKIRFQLEAGTLKATEAQRAEINAKLDSLVALDKTLAAQKEFNAALEKQEETNVKARQAMIEQAEAAELAAEMFGLNAAQISVVEQARLADAIAIARQNGASEEQIAYLEEELALRARLTGSLIKVEEKSQQKQDAEDALKALNEMDQFAVQAARNMQDAFAEFLFDPFAKGTDEMLRGFVQVIQKMLAQAVAAQLASALFGDFGKTGNVGGLVGSAITAFGFADGGIMTSAGAVPLRKYASGGIANSPQLAMFGEGSTPEAYVPLPDGRRIPVAMSGGQQSAPQQNIRIVNAFDNSVIQDYMGSAAGERIIMNAVQRNASAFRQAMA